MPLQLSEGAWKVLRLLQRAWGRPRKPVRDPARPVPPWLTEALVELVQAGLVEQVPRPEGKPGFRLTASGREVP